VFLLFSGLMLSSLVDLGMPFARVSGLLSDDCDRLRVFCAEPRMPSRLKLGVLADLSEPGDFRVPVPLAPVASCGEGISTEKSRLGSGNCLATAAALADVVMVAVAECGESPLDEGDMLNGALRCPGCVVSRLEAGRRLKLRSRCQSRFLPIDRISQQQQLLLPSTDRRMFRRRRHRKPFDSRIAVALALSCRCQRVQEASAGLMGGRRVSAWWCA
jgi:hypothetical protein